MRFAQFLLILFISTSGFSQDQEKSSKIFVEINLARYSKTPELTRIYSLENKMHFFNGVKLGIQKNEKIEMYVSLLKYASFRDQYFDYVGERYFSTGYQFGIGTSKIFFHKNRLSGQIGGELLFNVTKYDGVYAVDYNPFNFDLNNIHTYELGITSMFQLNYELSDYFSISTSTRIGMYYRFKATNENINLESKFSFLYEPVNSISLRVHLK